MMRRMLINWTRAAASSRIFFLMFINRICDTSRGYENAAGLTLVVVSFRGECSSSAESDPPLTALQAEKESKVSDSPAAKNGKEGPFSQRRARGGGFQPHIAGV